MALIDGVAPLFQVFDMPRSLVFYRDKLGFAVVQSAPEGTDECDWAMLERDGVTIMLNTMYEADSRPAAPDRARAEGHGDAALYFGCPDVDAAWRLIQEAGIEADPPAVSWYGMKQLYVRDPDGYTLCFQWPEGR